MKTIVLTSAFVLICLLTSNAQYNEQNLKLEPVATNGRYRFQNLQLYPIRANKTFESFHKDIGKYTTLKDALQKKKISITEHARGEVNTLFVENVSTDTIMILAGEVVQGGKQDRMIAQDFILKPKSGKKDISVFCVEHGRWQPAGSGSSFNDYYTISSNEVRKAGSVKKNQQEVWDKVSENTAKNNAGTSTGTLAALKESNSFNKDLKKYTDYFEKMFAQDAEVIGVVAVSGDAILSCDMFATHDIFQKHYINLINSYATEAITSGKPVTVPYEKVKTYLQTILEDESKQEEKVQKNGTILKDGKKKIHISTF